MARILIAEHNRTTAIFLGKTLRRQGHHVETVDNGLDTWRLCTHETYDILLVDITMPGIDGFVLAQKALQENPLLQVVFVTGFAAVAMDTFSTPAYAPAPVTTRPFHLKEIGMHLRCLLGQGYLPLRGNKTRRTGGNSVIYADFTAKKEQGSQVQQA